MSDGILVETKPGWDETDNEIRYRLREPSLFQDGSFRRITLQKQKPRVYAIAGKLKGDDAFTLQALRFPKPEWALSEAKKWLANHPEVRKEMAMDEETTVTTEDAAAEYVNERGIMTCEVRGASDDSRIRRFVGSTAMRDRCGDEIHVDGWDVKNYLKNPVFLWAHNYGDLPLGKAVSVEKTDKALVFDVEFAPEDANPTAEQVLRLYDGGFLRAVSVGFRSKSSEWIDRNDEDEAKRAKREPDAPVGRRFTKVELLELSAVPVPANPEALMSAKRKGLVVPEAKNFFYVATPMLTHQDGEAAAYEGVTYTTTTTGTDNALETVTYVLKREEAQPEGEPQAEAEPEAGQTEDELTDASLDSEQIPDTPEDAEDELPPELSDALSEVLTELTEEFRHG